MAFEIISERPIEDFNAVSKEIQEKALEYLGELGCAEAGIAMLPEKFNKEKQRGLVRVNNKSLDKLKATLALIEQIGRQNVVVRSRGTSGMLKKAEGKFIAG
ncbi:Rpp14/Pop5 family protein [Candidatus Woesearchaeota archaeon]|nr:Rpp14/Pop5 family protein [Candidatus Woesearchaeota archaeon]